jgi:hypothetical protein
MTALCKFEIFLSLSPRKGTRVTQTAAIFFISSASYWFSTLGASALNLRRNAAGLDGIELFPPIDGILCCNISAYMAQLSRPIIQLPHYSTASRTIILLPRISARRFSRSHSLARSEGQGFNYLYDHRPSLFAVFRSWHRLHSACQFD